ncbi:dihydrofolate reductase [Phreatobacter stygius]|uniref:Dihydrofolate reductase n=1 Tax=Phreatobacter stygius TaxID=1940610 RepID=A0A4D7BK86_9HYPH|nr:dihydrofolate reductase [Phreatobacter stygius]QCI68182.1 dihydrofolate reductase [Phreatobacter stygius]
MTPAPVRIAIEGHAIVSADGMIAEADGSMPRRLMNDADWRLFQAALDRAELVVLGRHGHQLHPNPGRRRLVLTRAVTGLVADPADRCAHFWNPGHMTFNHVLEIMGIAEGTVAVAGGTGVFDHFLDIGYAGFVLSTARGIRIPEGRPCFTAGPPGAVLAGHGLRVSAETLIDAEADVTMAVWQRDIAAPTRPSTP